MATATKGKLRKVMREPEHSSSSPRMRRFLIGSIVTFLTSLMLVAYLSPFGYMAVTSLKDLTMISDTSAPVLPSVPETYEYEGEQVPVLQVPIDGETRALALVQAGREASVFVDPAAPDAGFIEWEGRWRQLNAAYELAPQWDNYSTAWDTLDLTRILFNTFAIAAIGVVGTLASSIAVAYGFSRFKIPYKRTLFIILISTIILPRYVTLVPTFAFFTWIGWTGTWLPLLVPHFFANAYNIFLLRQYFLTIPRALDEAAALDGASPLRTLWSVILPNAKPAIVAVSLFHFFFAWNDFFEPLIYLAAQPQLQPISVAMQQFNALYAQQPQLIQATAMLGMILPVLLFFAVQKVFLKGASLAGVSK
jgi:multiple sugar transport system permease protein